MPRIISCTASRQASPVTSIRTSCLMRSFRPAPTISSLASAMTALRNWPRRSASPNRHRSALARNRDRIANREALRAELAACSASTRPSRCAIACSRRIAGGAGAEDRSGPHQCPHVHRGDVIEKDWYKGVASPIRCNAASPACAARRRNSASTQMKCSPSSDIRKRDRCASRQGVVCGSERKR